MSHQNPFFLLFENEKVKSRVQERIKRAERARNNLLNIEEKISNKDKYITRTGQIPCDLPGYVSHKGDMEKVFNKYENVAKKNDYYKEVINKRPNIDNYYKNYIDNKKPPKVDKVQEKKEYENDKKEYQKKIRKDWDNQIITDNSIRDKNEYNYRQKLEKDINIYDEKIQKQTKIKRDKIKRNIDDYLKINKKLIEERKQKNINNKKNNFDYEVSKAKENQKEIDSFNDFEKKYIKDKKAEFNRVLDEQNKEQQRKYQRLRDIEYGNF